MQRAGAFAPHKRFAAGKTLAQGGFTPPEHVKYPGSPRDGIIPWGAKNRLVNLIVKPAK